MAYAPSRRRTALAFGVSSLMVLAFCGLQKSFVALSPAGAASPRSEVRLPAGAGQQQTARAAPPSASVASWGIPAALALGAAVVLASQSRDQSSTTMYGKHDKKTFRGKQHAHSFGKYRMRKNKARRIQAIKNGTYDPENTPQRGQPEPEHTWDYDNIVDNPIYYAPDYLKEVMADYWDDVNEVMRKKWKDE
ncbi:tsf [Symbiodinium sp. CCMP2456]|nr:tsf [Symbiodinium sp. CCMP2456]